MYDATGSTEDGLGDKSYDEWYEVWRTMFQKITVKDIEEFEAKYRGSEMELEDLREAYIEAEGDIDGIFERVPCCSAEDEERFRSLLEPFLSTGDLPELAAWTPDDKKRKRRLKKAEKEAREAEQLAEELGIKPGQSLESAIMARRGGGESLEEENMSKHGEQMTGIADALAAKYGPGGPEEEKQKKGRRTGKKKKVAVEPSEEEFLALQQKMFTKPKNSKKESSRTSDPLGDISDADFQALQAKMFAKRR